MTAALDRFIAEGTPGWIETRRDLHRHPELAFTEYRTAALVAERLEALGYRIRLGAEVMDGAAAPNRPDAAGAARERARASAQGAPERWLAAMAGGLTGVVGEIARGDGPVAAYRFDMDALPLEEAADDEHRPAREGFGSINPGVMHACGHDGHTAIGLGLAEWLARGDSGWRGTARLIFQPAEEVGDGAPPMVAAGVVDDVDYFFAAHLGCELDTGFVAAHAEQMLSSSKFDATFTGYAAHAAGNPHEGRNALLAGATAALNLHAIARHALAETYVNVGRMIAGTGRNIVPGGCLLEFEVRADSDEGVAYMEGRARQVIAAAAAMHGAEHTLTLAGRGLGATSSGAAADMVAAVARATPGVREVRTGWPLGGSEDATHFLKRVQERGREACYFLIGSRLAACHHATRFDFDEAALPLGVHLFAGLAAATGQD